MLELPLGDPLRPALVSVSWTEDGKLALCAGRAGDYVIELASGRSVPFRVPALGSPRDLPGPWRVRFRDGRGAPGEAVFPELASWTEHSHRDVRHYSGTAVYAREFELAPSTLADDVELILDLGDVQVMAEVIVNGQNLGILWHPPFAVTIGSAARPGGNHLEVHVTNLWLNRLIGDAHIPLHQPLTPWVDVTDTVRHAVRGARLPIDAANAHFGDPAPDIVKELRVWLQVDGNPKQITVRENDTLRIEAPHGKLAVRGALYGTQLDRADASPTGPRAQREMRYTRTTRPMIRAIDEDRPLLPSGLLGPVRLVQRRRLVLDP